MTIADFAKQHRLKIQTDSYDGTPLIPGRKGQSQLFEYGDSLLGVMVMPNAGTARWWNAARSAFAESGMQICQDGDQEGVAIFDPENPEQVRLALKYAEVKRKRKVSDKDLQRLAELGFKKPPQAAPRSSQSESGNTVQGEKTRQKRRVRRG